MSDLLQSVFSLRKSLIDDFIAIAVETSTFRQRYLLHFHFAIF